MKTETIICDLCKHDDASFFMEKEGFTLVRCNVCNLVYTNPRPTKKELIKAYNTEMMSPASYYSKTNKEDTMTFENRIDKIMRYKKSGRLLDIGCNVGHLLRVAKSKGFRVYGLDLNKKCINKELNISQGEIASKKFNEPFDVVIMNDVMEHVSSPTDTIKGVKRNMKKGGIIYLALPDMNSLVAKIFRTKWSSLLPTEHLYYFNKNTIRRLLTENGFKIESMGYSSRYRSGWLILDRLTNYSKLASKLLSLILPNKLIIKIKLYDDLEVIARKTN